MRITKVINEAGHFALVQTDEGFGIQTGGVRFNRETNQATRIGTDHNIGWTFNDLDEAKEIFSGMEKSLEKEFAVWGTE